jgi:hypothetical protein
MILKLLGRKGARELDFNIAAPSEERRAEHISHSNSQGSIGPFGSSIVLLQIQYTVMTTASATR